MFICIEPLGTASIDDPLNIALFVILEFVLISASVIVKFATVGSLPLLLVIFALATTLSIF